MSIPPDSAARLCAECGMCCNGVLFHSVVLQPGDSERALSALGLKIKRRGQAPHFLQPCAAHRESRCDIYHQRPQRCRLFDCRQLLRVAAGESSEADALEIIRHARELATRVDLLIQRVAGTNPRRALAQRYASAMTPSPDDTPELEPLRRELSVAMQALEAALERDFRVPQ